MRERASRPALRAALTSVGELEASMTPGGGRGCCARRSRSKRSATFQPGWWDPAIDLGGAHIWADELDEARELLESARQRATDAGDEETAEDVCRYLAQVEVRAGNLARAQAHAEAGMAIAEQEEPSWVLSGELFARALVAAHQGDADLARELAARGIPMTEGLGDEVFAILHHGVLGFLELSLGNPGEALAHLEPLPARLERLGIREPREPGAFLSEEDAIEALIGTGRIEEAEARLDAWEELGREIERPRVLATAARARGLLAADRGDLDRAIAHSRRPSDTTIASPSRSSGAGRWSPSAARTGERASAGTLGRRSRRRWSSSSESAPASGPTVLAPSSAGSADGRRAATSSHPRSAVWQSWWRRDGRTRTLPRRCSSRFGPWSRTSRASTPSWAFARAPSSPRAASLRRTSPPAETPSCSLLGRGSARRRAPTAAGRGSSLVSATISTAKRRHLPEADLERVGDALVGGAEVDHPGDRDPEREADLLRGREHPGGGAGAGRVDAAEHQSAGSG